MSSHPQYEDGAYGVNPANNAAGPYDVHGAYPAMGGPQGPPNVYQPQPQATPAYDEYADPATAHGWQNAYDETAQLPPVNGDASDVYGPGGQVRYEQYGAYDDYQEPAGEHEGSGSGGDHRSVFVDGSGRRGRLMRRAAIAVGAVCVLFIAVVVAGFFDSGPSGNPLPWVQGQEDGAKKKDADSVSPTSSPGDATSAGAGGTTRSETASASDGTSGSPSATKGGSTGGDRTQEPTRAPSTTTAPTTTAPERGNSGDKPGRGQGSTKGPK
jgi:hypothetical protein